MRDPAHTIREEIEEAAAEWKDRLALVGDGETLAHRELFARACRWARWSILHGVAPGERVALLFAPRPELWAAWIGVTMVGGVAVVLDDRLPGPALARSIAAARPLHLVVDATLLPRFEAAAAHLAVATAVWVHGSHDMAYMRVDEALAELSPARLFGRDRRSLAHADDALWIDASDAEAQRFERLDHGGVLAALAGLAAAARATRDDRLVVPRPAPGDLDALLAPGVALLTGGLAVVLADADPARTSAEIDRRRATLLTCDGALAARLADAPPADASPRLIFGRDLSGAAHARLRARFPDAHVIETRIVAPGARLLLGFDGIPAASADP